MNIIMLKQTENEVLIEKKEVESLDLDTMYSLIGCRYVDVKNIHPIALGSGLPSNMLLVFDDEFLIGHDNPKANKIASFLFGYLMHGQSLCGNVILCQDDKEGNMTGFSDEESDDIIANLNYIDEFVSKIEFVVQEPTMEFVQF